eukprot:scaffold1670_cov108-Isochrysis_galbana.AAC.6
MRVRNGPFRPIFHNVGRRRRDVTRLRLRTTHSRALGLGLGWRRRRLEPRRLLCPSLPPRGPPCACKQCAFHSIF